MPGKSTKEHVKTRGNYYEYSKITNFFHFIVFCVIFLPPKLPENISNAFKNISELQSKVRRQFQILTTFVLGAQKLLRAHLKFKKAGPSRDHLARHGTTDLTIQIFLRTYPPNLVEYFSYLQHAFKMIFDVSATEFFDFFKNFEIFKKKQ